MRAWRSTSSPSSDAGRAHGGADWVWWPDQSSKLFGALTGLGRFDSYTLPPPLLTFVPPPRIRRAARCGRTDRYDLAMGPAAPLGSWPPAPRRLVPRRAPDPDGSRPRRQRHTDADPA